MRQVLAMVGLALEVAMFTLVCLAATPCLLFKFGVDRLRERIESRWPDSGPARAASCWIGLLAPVIFLVLAVMVVFAACKLPAGKAQ